MIKAIETEYNGYRFRSRLEARWTVFFDSVGIKYEYEPEGFEMEDGTRYLPDFYLPDLDLWVEVKGVLSKFDEEKIRGFAVGKKVALLREIPNPKLEEMFGEIGWNPYGENGKFFGGEIYEGIIEENGDVSEGWDAPYVFCVCPACGKVGYEFDGRGWRVCGEKHKNKNSETQTYDDGDGIQKNFRYYMPGRTDDKGYSGGAKIILDAYQKARQARFEHGERP